MLLFLPHNKINHYECNDDQLHRNQKSRFILKYAECCSAIVDVSDVKYSADQRYGTVQHKIGSDQVFRQLIKCYNNCNNDKIHRIQVLDPFSFS